MRGRVFTGAVDIVSWRLAGSYKYIGVQVAHLSSLRCYLPCMHLHAVKQFVFFHGNKNVAILFKREMTENDMRVNTHAHYNIVLFLKTCRGHESLCERMSSFPRLSLNRSIRRLYHTALSDSVPKNMKFNEVFRKRSGGIDVRCATELRKVTEPTRRHRNWLQLPIFFYG